MHAFGNNEKISKSKTLYVAWYDNSLTFRPPFPFRGGAVTPCRADSRPAKPNQFLPSFQIPS
jgi:hypothetical protein